jgi:hypothetical protein
MRPLVPQASDGVREEEEEKPFSRPHWDLQERVNDADVLVG